MFSDEYKKLCLELDGVLSHLEMNSSLRSLLAQIREMSEPSIRELELLDLKEKSPENIQWRVMDHCSAIGRLYGLYEQYCENILRDWLQYLTSRRSFADLPEGLVKYYPAGFSHIVSLLPSFRYAHLSVKQLVSGYDAALKGEATYQLVPECLTHHRNNLRWDELHEIYRRCGVNDVQDWIAANKELAEFFGTGGERTIEQVSAKMTEFVQYRNDASDGSVSVGEILGPQQFAEFVQFIRIFCGCLNELHRRDGLLLLESIDRVRRIGKVTERFKENIVVCTLTDGSFSVGDTLILFGKKACVESKILSIQLNDVPKDSFVVDREVEIGFKLDKPISLNSAVFSNPSW